VPLSVTLIQAESGFSPQPMKIGLPVGECSDAFLMTFNSASAVQRAFDNFRRGNPLGMEFHGVGVELRHLQQRVRQPLRARKPRLDVADELRLLLRRCGLQQVGHHQHGGERCFELMGNIRKRILELVLVARQRVGLLLFEAHQRLDVVAQDAQAALPVVQKVRAIAVYDTADGAG